MLLKQIQPQRSLVSLTPLIDVVFILLIFFMLASNFIEWQFIEFNIGEAEEIVIDHKSISVIEVKSDNDIYLDNTKMELSSVVKIVREHSRKNINHPINIQLHENVSLQSLVTLLDSINEFAKDNISISKAKK